MFTALFWRKVVASFFWAFLVVFVGGVLPVWDSIVAGDWETTKAALLALVAAAGTSAFRAAQALFTSWESDIE